MRFYMLNRATKNYENVVYGLSYNFMSKIVFNNLYPKASPVLLQNYVYSFFQRAFLQINTNLSP